METIEERARTRANEWGPGPNQDPGTTDRPLKGNQHRILRGVHFLRVQGNSTERARAHGSFLKEQIRQGAIPALSKKNEWIIRRSPGFTQHPAVQSALLWFYHKVLLPHLDRRNPKEVRELLNALSEETGIPYREYLGSLVQADAFMLLCRLSVMKYTMGDLPSGGMPGCTSAVTLKDWTASGRLMACRNQDYPMVGPWEKNTTVLFHEPSESDQIPHVSVTTAGVHTSGLTSMNREGMTLFTHAHFGRNVTLRGTPIIDIGNEVIRKARTLGQAIDIARKFTPYANWALIIASAKENDAVVLEMTPSKTHVRHAEDGFLAHSNYFHSPELQRQEALMSGSYIEDLESRYCRIRQVLEEVRGSVDVQHMTAALGDHIDYLTGEERVVGNTVSVVTTIKSAVFDPLAQKMWVSSRAETPMGLGDFVEIDVDQFWGKHASRSDAQWPVVPGYQPRNPALVEGVRHYRDAYRAHHMENHLPDFEERTLESLRKAAAAFPSDGNLWVQTAIVAFRQHGFKEARECLERTRDLKLSKHTAWVRDLFLARSLDLTGEREAAVALYTQGLKVKDPNLNRAMKAGLKKPYRAADTARLLIDLQFPDTFHY